MKLQFNVMDNEVPRTYECDLNEDESNALIKARNVLKRIYKHEELYDQVIETYLELKTAMYDMSIKSAANAFPIDYVRSHEYRSKLNRLIFNSLNFGKMYLDEHYKTVNNGKAVKTYVAEVTGNDSNNNELKKQRAHIYDNNPNYVLACDLRNYVQHASLPVGSVNSGARTVEGDRFSTFYTTIKRDEIKKAKKETLDKFDDSIDLHEVMDGYITAISEKHIFSREMIIEAMRESLDHIKSIDSEMRKNNDIAGAILVRDENNNFMFSLGTKWFDIVKHLQSKHSRPLYLGSYKHHPYKEK
ncbi:hypothetical protein ACOSZP_18100 [Vibrio fluvialis]|uniref:hypothetical protein n=1 Tax=Vibrio fluvialis TaxID=676 RepID=UPI003B9E509F